MSVDVMMVDGAAHLENAEMELDAPNDFTEAMQQDDPAPSSSAFSASAPVSFEPDETVPHTLEEEMTVVEAEPPSEEQPVPVLEVAPEGTTEDTPAESEVSKGPSLLDEATESQVPLVQAAIPLPPAEISEAPDVESRDDPEDATDDLPAEELAADAHDEARIAEERDELEEASREITPELGLDESPSRPVPMLEYLGNVTMPAIPNASASDTSSDTSIKAPPLKLSYLNETFWLFAEDADEHATPLASTSTSHHPTGVHPVLLGQPDDHRLYYVALESVFAHLHESFPSFADDAMEMVLCMPHDYGIEIGEDNAYARDISLYDLDRIHVGCNREGRLHLTLDARVRAISRFNRLAAHVAQYTGLLPLDDDEAPENASVSDGDVDDLTDLRDDENNSNDDETEGTAIEDLTEAGAEKLGEPDELEEGGEAVAPEQYEDAVDESGLAEAQHAPSTEEDEEKEDEFAAEAAPSQSATVTGEAEHDTVDEIEEAAAQPAAGFKQSAPAVNIPQSVTADTQAASIDGGASAAVIKSPKRGREEDVEAVGPAGATSPSLLPESKRVRAE